MDKIRVESPDIIVQNEKHIAGLEGKMRKEKLRNCRMEMNAEIKNSRR